jgi:hypothetical protein
MKHLIKCHQPGLSSTIIIFNEESWFSLFPSHYSYGVGREAQSFHMRPHSLTFLQKPNIINVLYNTLNSSTEYVSYLLEETIALFTIFFSFSK